MAAPVPPHHAVAVRDAVDRHWREGLLAAPAAVACLRTLSANLDVLVERAHGRPIRVATKSVRCNGILSYALQRPGFAGLMAFSLAEALWLAEKGVSDDILVAYPSVDRLGLARLARDPLMARSITVMLDDPVHLDMVAAAGAPERTPIQVCLDVDASLRLGPAHLGTRRSPVRTPQQAEDLARRAAGTPGVAVAGVMFYDAQIAGLPDSSAAVRAVKRASDRDLRRRRGAVVEAVASALSAEGAAPLRFVNGGGSGSLHVTGADDALTELAAGSGIYGPTSFDGFRGWKPQPALFVVLPIVRRPAPGIVTAFGGGYVASGAAGVSRLPTPVWPRGARLLRAEGAGEVQTPLRLARGASEAGVGDLAWLRPTKAGEPLERFDLVHVVEPDYRVRSTPTYRGEGRCFG